MQKTTNTDILKIYDFHSHILPGLDHGCSDTAVAMEQIRRAVRAGVHCILATSHFYPHAESVDSFLRRRRLAWVHLQKELAGEEEIQAAGIQIVQGAEVLICKGLERMEGLEQLCIDGTKVLLLEMPFTEIWDPELINTVTALQDKCRAIPDVTDYASIRGRMPCTGEYRQSGGKMEQAEVPRTTVFET